MSRIADLILARGDAQSRGIADRGAIWGNAINGMGQTFAQLAADYPKMRASEQDQKKAAQEEADLRALFGGKEPPTFDALAAKVGPERAAKIATGMAALRPSPADTQKKAEILRDTLLGLDALPEGVRADYYPTVRGNLIARGIITAQDAPEQYDPAFWAQATRYGKAPETPTKPEGFTLGEGQSRFDANGQPIASVPKTVVPEKVTPVKPGSEEDFIARFAKDLGKSVDDLTAAQVEAARRRYAQSTRFVEPKAPRGQIWVTRNGQPIPIEEGSAQPGDVPYDPVAVRQNAGNTNPNEAKETAAEIERVASALLNHPGLGAAFGVIDAQLPTMFQSTAEAEELANTLRGLLTLDNTGKLKGVLSNADMIILRQASTTLANRVGDTSARAELRRIIDKVRQVTGGSGASMFPVQTPDGQTFTFPTQAAADAFRREAGIR